MRGEKSINRLQLPRRNIETTYLQLIGFGSVSVLLHCFSFHTKGEQCHGYSHPCKWHVTTNRTTYSNPKIKSLRYSPKVCLVSTLRVSTSALLYILDNSDISVWHRWVLWSFCSAIFLRWKKSIFSDYEHLGCHYSSRAVRCQRDYFCEHVSLARVSAFANCQTKRL